MIMSVEQQKALKGIFSKEDMERLAYAIIELDAQKDTPLLVKIQDIRQYYD